MVANYIMGLTNNGQRLCSRQMIFVFMCVCGVCLVFAIICLMLKRNGTKMEKKLEEIQK